MFFEDILEGSKIAKTFYLPLCIQHNKFVILQYINCGNDKTKGCLLTLPFSKEIYDE